MWKALDFPSLGPIWGALIGGEKSFTKVIAAVNSGKISLFSRFERYWHNLVGIISTVVFQPFMSQINRLSDGWKSTVCSVTFFAQGLGFCHKFYIPSPLTPISHFLFLSYLLLSPISLNSDTGLLFHHTSTYKNV